MKTNQDKATARPFKSEWAPCSREWFNDLAKFRSGQGNSPITDSILAEDTGDSSLIFNLAQQCRKFESEHAALEAVAEWAECAARVMESLDLRPAHQSTATELGIALANLAAVRSAIAKAKGEA